MVPQHPNIYRKGRGEKQQQRDDKKGNASNVLEAEYIEIIWRPLSG